MGFNSALKGLSLLEVMAELGIPGTSLWFVPGGKMSFRNTQVPPAVLNCALPR